MTTDQITEVESPEEKRYREVSTKITLLDLQIEEAERVLRDYCFLHPRISSVPGAMVLAGDDGRRDELLAELSRLQMCRQSLLPEYANLKFSLGLTR